MIEHADLAAKVKVKTDDLHEIMSSTFGVLAQ